MYRVPSASLRLALLAVALTSTPLSATRADSPTIAMEQALSLEPGKYLWRPQLAEHGPVEIVINLRQQRAYVFRGGTLIGASTISSGREGYESPIGRFKVLQKRQTHRSNRYDDAPMPYMQRLNWHGVALHGGHVPGYPASHGCIRLPIGFAKALYGVTELATFVYVGEDDVTSPDEALVLARLHADAPLSPDREFGGGIQSAESEGRGTMWAGGGD
jgi:hypothetical protein